MVCYKNGDCIMNQKNNTGVNFCISPRCIYIDMELKAIAKKITELLKIVNLSCKQIREINYLKGRYKYLNERR